MYLNGLADVEEHALAEVEQVGLPVGQHAVHALVPHGHDERRRGAVRHQPPHAPLETDVLLQHELSSHRTATELFASNLSSRYRMIGTRDVVKTDKSCIR